MILFHERLPCSENFFRYFRNYDKYMEDKLKASTSSDQNMASEEDLAGVLPQMAKSPIREIKSPKYGLGIQVIDKFMEVHSPTAGSPTQLSPNGQKMVFNIDTAA
jgi:hypothetical protein